MADLQFERILDMDVIKERTLANYEIWGTPLSNEGYLTKTFINGFHDNYMDKDHWYYYGLKNKEGVYESSLEVLVRDAWVRDADGDVKIIQSGVIGSVYTDEQFRGKNNIKYLLDGLHDTLKIDAFFLYSELGTYYEKFGYRSLNVPVWKMSPAADPEVDDSLYIDSVDQIESIASMMKQKLNDSLDKNTFCLVPSTEIFNWYNNRSRATFWDMKCGSAGPAPDSFYELAKTPGKKDCDALSSLKYGYSFPGPDGEQQYIMWYSDYGDMKMSILVINASTSEALKKLVSAALNHAHQQGIKLVEAWDLEAPPQGSDSVWDFLQAKKVEQNSSLSGLRIHGDYKWVANDKWCWF